MKVWLSDDLVLGLCSHAATLHSSVGPMLEIKTTRSH
jgi:hypothetical protein